MRLVPWNFSTLTFGYWSPSFATDDFGCELELNVHASARAVLFTLQDH